MAITEGRDPVNSGLALHAFRNQGFEPISAICEIIDNSIEAKASEIRIKFDWKKRELGQKYPRVEKFWFVDNGTGMDEKILFDCLVLGESTRRFSRKGIGKFGVGGTFAGISQAKHIEVFSKINGGKWLFTELDLDLLDKGVGIPKPIEKNPPEEHSKYVNGNGTIVLWTNVDRSDFHQNDIPKLKDEAGRIYRKFLTKEKLECDKIVKNNPTKIIIEDEEIKPYDPLFITYNPKLDDKEKPTAKSREVPLRLGNLKSKMVITTSYLPESWWNISGQPGSVHENKVERKIDNRNEGISVVREGREVLFGHIPYFTVNDPGGSGTGFVDKDRWTGVEVSFDRDADEIFGIQNNKSRLLMSSYARDKISEEISPTLVSRRNYFTSKRDETKAKGGGSKPTSFDGSKPAIQGGIDTPTYTVDQKKSLREFAEKIAANKTEMEEIYEDLIKGYHPQISFDLDPTGPFVVYEYELDSIIVKYNGNHPFMQKFFETLEMMATKGGVKLENALNIAEIQKVKTLFDILMASFGLSRKRFPDLSLKEEIESTINTLVANWGDVSHRLSKQKIDSG